ncbi:MAG TPA: hypothetical protein VFU05_19515 [Cyclobacteriaceae bacterium]|nr:hypothetical protein [Cyclobacteriaceae bacterium]
MKIAILIFGIFLLAAEGRSAAGDLPKLHIAFNQPAYVPGDTAFFRGYLLNAGSLEYVPGMNVVNIKLLDQESNTRLFDRVIFFDGIGINQLVFPADLPSGVYDLVAYSDEMMRSNDPSTFFRTAIIIAGKRETRFKQDVKPVDSIKTNKTKEESESNVMVEVNLEREYGVRALVQLDVKVKNLAYPKSKSDFSVSVFKEELFPSIPPNSFSGNLKAAKPGSEKSNPKKAIYFSGKAYFTATKKPVPDSTLIAFYLNKQMVVYGLNTKKGGRFDFPLFMALEDDEIFYAMEYKGKLLKDVKIDVEDYAIELKAEIPESTGSAPDPYTSFTALKKTISGSFKYFSNKNRIQPPHVYDEEEFEVDYNVDLNKFKEFPTMEETLHEVVPLVQCHKIKGKTDVRVFMYTAMTAKRSPLYIIDGVMTDSTEYFLSLDPGQVATIGVMRSESTLLKYGALGKNGILVVTTKGISDNSVPISSSVLSITGVNKSHKYPEVKYNTEAKRTSRVPDLRTALHWNPRVVTDQQGKATIPFYTGDVTGTFRVQIEGITVDGYPFFYETRFNVSEKRH